MREFLDATKRFSDRVNDYIRYRPDYPVHLIQELKQQCGLTPASVVADIGSGTGLLTRQFLCNKNKVYGVEPNAEMRQAAETLLSAFGTFISIDGTAEATGLPPNSVDFITAGQAFHWFDMPKACAEFSRIIRPAGVVVLVWNDRETEETPFLRAYEELLKTYCPDYLSIRRRYIDQERLHQIFGHTGYRTATFANEQVFDFDGLEGRLLSASYAPRGGHPNHEAMMRALAGLFREHEQEGSIRFLYTTRMVFGRVATGEGE
ncbi:MAG: class I SAM-dependent methyltransferase [bacterium]